MSGSRSTRRAAWAAPVIALAALAALGGCASTGSGDDGYGDGEPVVGVDVFYEELAPYGRWLEVDAHGWVWTPYGTDPFWRPYTVGRWVYTDYGWTWLSDEPWGWASYHYGRWVDHPFYGWLWVPGTVWGPAWVVWHGDADWIGWAPLPPDAIWQPDDGVRVREMPARYDWSFVPRRRFLERRLADEVVPAARNEELLRRTVALERVGARDGRPVSGGPEPDAVERATGRSLERLQVVDGRTAASPQVDGGRAAFYRPRVGGEVGRRAPAERIRTDGASVSAEEARRERERMLDDLEQRAADERRRLDEQHREERLRQQEAAAERLRRQQEEMKALEEETHRRQRVIEERTERRVIKPREQQQETPRQRTGEERRRGGR